MTVSVGVPLVAVLLVACSTTGSTKTTSTAGSSDPTVTLSILALSTFQPALPVVISDFTAKYPHTTFNVTYVPSATYTSLIGSQLANGTAADIVSVSPGSASAQAVIELGKAGYLKNLAGQPWVKDVPAAYKESMGVGNKVYSPAIATRALTTFYNETVMKKDGFTIPTTWNQVLSLCSKAQAKGIAAYTIGAATDYENQMLTFALLATLVPDTAKFIQERTAGTTTFTKSAWLTMFQKEDQMYKAGCFAKDPAGTSINAAQAEVANGQALAYTGQSNQYPTMAQLAPSVKFVSTSFPATNDASQTRLSIALEGSFGINADVSGEKLVVAKRFFDFMMSPDENGKLATALSDAPGVPSAKFVPTAGTEALATYTKEGKTTLVADQFFPNPNVRTVWITTNEKMLSGQATPEDITQAMDSAWTTGNQ